MKPREGTSLTLVSVSGACSRSGKTALAVTLLRSLPAGAAAALKFTTTDDVFERCPRGTPCVVCDIDVPFRIVSDARTLREPGTDTDRLAAAGASRVLWVIARRGEIEAAWRAVKSGLGERLLVMEGSTIVDHARPELRLFVVHPFLSPSRWKPTSGRLIRDADLVLLNRPSTETRPPAPEVTRELRRLRGEAGVRVADVTRPLAEWAPGLARRLRAAAGAPAAAAESEQAAT